MKGSPGLQAGAPSWLPWKNQGTQQVEIGKWEGKRMSKTILWVGNTIICCLLASFFARDYVGGAYVEVSDLFGAMVQAVGSLLGGLLVGYIATRFMKEASDRHKNIAYFLGVLLSAGAAVFNKMYVS